MPYKMDIALSVIERIARSMEPNFVMTKEVEAVYARLIKWFHGDDTFMGYLNKGLLLMGPTGTGKTLAMNVMLRYREIDNVIFCTNGKWQKLTYDIADVNVISKAFANNAYDGISIYVTRNALCIDDLGYETGIHKRFGNAEDVIPFILGERYNRKLLTFATTNFPLEKIEEQYDDRTYSRICGMFNFITMKAQDFRKSK